MISEAIIDSGIDIIGEVPWGTHFCQFYEDGRDLLDILTRYFKAGLENNEFCMWVTSAPVQVEDAKLAMRYVMPDVDRYIENGQLEIIPYDEWYVQEGTFDQTRVLNGWVEKLDAALARGFNGLRLTGNTTWLETKDWQTFTDYEEAVDTVLGRYRMMALCTYKAGLCGVSEVADVVSNHKFALIRRNGQWDIIESGERRRAEEERERLIMRLQAHNEQIQAQSEELQLQNEEIQVQSEELGSQAEELRVQNDELLQAYQMRDRLAAIVDSSEDAIIGKDLDGKILSWNKGAEGLYGYSEDEAIGKRISILVPPDHTDDLPLILERLKRGEHIERYETVRVRKDGSRLDVSISVAPIKDRSGGITGASTIVHDITERKRAEDERDALLERISALADISSALLSTENPRTFVSNVFERLSRPLGLDVFFNYMVLGNGPSMELNAFGGVPQEVGESIKHLEFGQAVCGCVARDGERIIAKHIQRSRDPRADLVRSFGVDCYVCHPLMSSDGRVLGTLSFGTKRKPRMDADEIELLRTVCDYVAIAFERADSREAEHAARVRAQEAVNARDEFLSVASHEFKTPVTSMLGFSQLALRRLDKGQELDPERTKRSFEVIEQQANKLAALTVQLLDISRIQSGKLILEPKATDLAALIERVAASIQMSTGDHTILLNSPTELWATVDPLRIEQVAVNLLDNAVKYSPNAGDIEVELASPDPGSVLLVVRDHGLGIPPEERGRIFERFFQGNRDKVVQGLGLGLHITKQIVNLHGGHIEAEFPDDGGTRFVVTLPS